MNYPAKIAQRLEQDRAEIRRMLLAMNFRRKQVAMDKCCDIAAGAVEGKFANLGKLEVAAMALGAMQIMEWIAEDSIADG